MSNLSENLMNSLLQLKGYPADHITHSFKTLGGGEDGSMIDGVIRMVTALDEDKKGSVNSAKIRYGIGGAVITSIIWGGAWMYNKKKEKKQHEEECKVIEKTFENKIETANTPIDNEE